MQGNHEPLTTVTSASTVDGPLLHCKLQRAHNVLKCTMHASNRNTQTASVLQMTDALLSFGSITKSVTE